MGRNAPAKTVFYHGVSDRSAGNRRAPTSIVAAIVFLGTLLVLSGYNLRLGAAPFSATRSSLEWNEMQHTSVSSASDALYSRFVLSAEWDERAAPTIRTFNWTVSEVWAKPGLLPRRMIAVNRLTSPGPTIVANLGDTIVVNVINDMEIETAIHWHGQFQNGTNFYDGTAGITQCGIPPNGGSFTYRFTVQNVGTFWYHAHFGSQRTDGLYGAMILHSREDPVRDLVTYDQDVVLVVGDFYNTHSEILTPRFLRYGSGLNGNPGTEPIGDGGIINGVSQARCAYLPATDSVLPERRRKRDEMQNVPRARSRPLISRQKAGVPFPNLARNPGDQGDQPVIPENVTCAKEHLDTRDPRSYASLNLQKGRTYRLRIINAGSFSSIHFSIDGHPLTIVEADGVATQPHRLDSILVGAAQRYSALITLDDEREEAFWVRASLEEESMDYENPYLNATTLAVLRYTNNLSSLPADVPGPVGGKGSDPTYSLMPHPRVRPPSPDRVVLVKNSDQYTSDGEFLSFFNETSWSPLGNETTLMLTRKSPEYPFSDEASDAGQLILASSKIETIDLALDNLDDMDHPFHLHGHTFSLMSHGVGRYIGQSTGDGSEDHNPMRRDTVIVPAYSYAVMRFTTDNPGLWAFHCHIVWHLEAGLMMQVASLSGLSDLVIPDHVRQGCRSPS